MNVHEYLYTYMGGGPIRTILMVYGANRLLGAQRETPLVMGQGGQKDPSGVTYISNLKSI